MADRQTAKARPREEAAPPRELTAEEFEKTPEFRRFKAVMRRLVAVPKSEIDAMVQKSREKSPRAGNPNAPGRKRKKR